MTNEEEKEYISIEDPKAFHYLNSRIHTRESSTLVISTVAVSASLVFLGVLIGRGTPLDILPSLYLSCLNVPAYLQPLAPGIFWIMMNYFYTSFQNSNICLTGIGLAIILLGIGYRELTMHSIDNYDYNKLEQMLGKTKDPNNGFELRPNPNAIKARKSIICSFFGTVIIAWILYILEWSLGWALIYSIAVLVIVGAIIVYKKDC